ncbi:MAG: hypothetical protein OQK32_09155 [Gammaproteobacteria bacterium]|nr:hypothetical protein [Gammaproteobacteria bacterium]MCW8924443.1 hypothetical protein [Gammaproteobacteria bacterium]
MVENNQGSPNTKNSRQPNGLLIFALLAGFVFAISYRPSIETVYCNAETLSPRPDIIMLSTSWCPYCVQARRYFAHNKIRYCEYDIEKNIKGKKLYDHANRYADKTGMPLGTPVLFIGEHQLSGFDRNRIEELLIKLKLL